MAEPTDPKELAIVNAQDQYETSSAALHQLIASPPPEDADFFMIDSWVIDAQFHWETCTHSWRIAKVSSIEWRRLEYNMLELFTEIPDDQVAYSCVEYNELVKRARQFSMNVVPVPLSQMPTRQLAPKAPTSSSAPVAPARAQTTTPAVVPPVPSVPSRLSPVIAPPPAIPAVTTVVPPAKPPFPVKLRPIFKNKTPLASDDITTTGASFELDVTSPLHPNIATLLKTGPPKSVIPSEGSMRSSQRLQAVNAASRRQVLPGPNPIPEGSVASSSRKRTPLFFPGTDDEEEIATPGATEKGKGKEVVPGTDEDEEDVIQDHDTSSNIMDVDEEDNSPPPTNIAWRYRSPVPGASSGPPPITVSEVRPRLSIHHADPNSALFKLLGAPPANKPKKGSRRKPKFDNPPPPPKDIVDERTIRAKRSKKKATKDKEIEEVTPSDVVPTKANRPRGPSRLRAPPATIGIQIGGFGEEVPADYKAVQNRLKSIGVLVVSRDFGEFVEVDKALWNKKIAPFVGEQYVKPCDSCHRKKTQCRKFLTNSVICVRCHYAKLPCLVNGTKALNPLAHYRPKSYESINAFESSMDTLSQHANALEDIIVNYMTGLDAISQLQGLRSQIGRLRECLGSDSRVEEVIEEEDNEGSDVDDVAEGEPGPSRKRKRSGK
ncbi:hypothetical protein EDD18DRAFT_1360775 [Armillaria luteobubalina]|uniref:Zn(2)-C6 fungal-type domain-containing protein n=1 Tax=Armillaria luteobubalina TaxID=153913 RepID=A0AA39PJT3_9AGAR|nr:hypothetical protein EDD18DRAFT_1360775 [Armillaria luteobubalina]